MPFRNLENFLGRQDRTLHGRRTRLNRYRSWQVDFHHGCDEPVSPARDGLHKAWLLRIVLHHLPNLADRGVDAAVGIEEDVLTPDPLDDLVAGDQLPSLLY